MLHFLASVCTLVGSDFLIIAIVILTITNGTLSVPIY